MDTSPRNRRHTAIAAALIGGAALGLAGAFVAAAATGSTEQQDPTFGREVPTELVEYARRNGLSGLSPASLQAVDTSAYADIDDIEAYARTNGLSGLSPASLGPAPTQP
jgi:hypothetical protein